MSNHGGLVQYTNIKIKTDITFSTFKYCSDQNNFFGGLSLFYHPEIAFCLDAFELIHAQLLHYTNTFFFRGFTPF